jgi:glycosyltransferase involved in cell wall biosynthesis
MKIICTVINDLTYDQRMQRICKSLQEEGHEVVLIGRRLKTSKPLTKHTFGQRRVKCFFNKGKLFYIEYNIRLWWILLFSSFDVVCSVDLDTILPGFYISKMKGKVCVYDAHEYFSEVPEVVNRRLTKAVWEKVADWTIPKLKYAYTVSQSLATELSERYQTSFGVIRNVPFQYQSISEEVTQSIQRKYHIQPKETTEKILIYQGALNDGRGIEELLEAVKTIENLSVWLVGEGDLSDFLRKKAQILEVMDKVTFLGFVPPADLKVLTKMADIGYNLLENKGKSYYYSLSNKSFDYVQAEKPALHPNFPEYIYLNQQHEIGILVDDLSGKAIKRAILQLLTDEDLYNQLAKNCQTAKSEWTWEKEEKNLLMLYQSIEKAIS